MRILPLSADGLAAPELARLHRPHRRRAAAAARARGRPLPRRVDEGHRPRPRAPATGRARCYRGRSGCPQSSRCSPAFPDVPVYVGDERRARGADRLPPAPRRARVDAPAGRCPSPATCSRAPAASSCSRTSSTTRTSARSSAASPASAPTPCSSRRAAPIRSTAAACAVSMGTVLQVPWTRLPSGRRARPAPRRGVHHRRARALRRAEDLDVLAADPPERLALVLGTEGDGLSRAALAVADRHVRIPMAHGVDSLNVAAAAALAVWAVRPR